ncbi:AraC family transcriptional regulator [Micromonospora sp. WMMD998]|uniref:AraC family transcriptional regulator n=1 Tax=Micromonospora sp. WMMD998 TaxID=3016092 RepID=UPI002499C62F|nr:AraC family transcriptional regulator [Micromonospora sp. WMMD998]WFE39999.1 AraC family transcriptional regulator [Micromonospora sp. WMMD998]
MRAGPAGATISAWRPRLDGVVEVLHAHFTGHAYPMHAHDAWALLIVDEGGVRYDLDRHERGASGDLVTLLPPHVPHNGTSASAHGFRKRVLYLAPDQLPDALVGASVDNSAFADPSLRRAVSRLHHAIRRPGEELEAESRLVAVTERLRVHLGHPGLPARLDRTPAHRLRELLEANVVAGVSLREAAATLHFHPAYLVRSFGREFGMPPHKYLISRRVDLARRLILAGEPLHSVAASSGFHDQPHLNRHFTRILGVSPKRFAPARH